MLGLPACCGTTRGSSSSGLLWNNDLRMYEDKNTAPWQCWQRYTTQLPRPQSCPGTPRPPSNTLNLPFYTLNISHVTKEKCTEIYVLTCRSFIAIVTAKICLPSRQRRSFLSHVCHGLSHSCSHVYLSIHSWLLKYIQNNRQNARE